MAKVEIELPDDLLYQVDRYARRAEESRDEFLRRIITEGIDRCHEKLRAELEGLLDGVEFDFGDQSAEEWLRHDRDHRDDKQFGSDGHVR
jgi:metal-responsive CopG/Arc/MetJ family transcriptional regulator